MRGLIDAFLKTDVAGHATPDLFRWLITNRHGFWMLDGLDEVIASDATFIAQLIDLLTAPDSSPLILVSVRDSLLRSSEQLNELVSGAGDAVRVLRLAPWGASEKRAFAWSRTQGRLPRRDDEDPEAVRDLLGSLSRTESLAALTSTPFYASIFAEFLERDPQAIPDDEFELLSMAIRQMCIREYAKRGPIRETVLPIEAFREWLEELGAEIYRNNGISLEDLRDLAELVRVLVETPSGDRSEHTLVEQMLAIPFITRGSM